MKVSIIGAGRVGSAVAFAVVLKRLADELVLVGSTPTSAEGDAADLTHASAFTQQMIVRSGDLDDTAGSQVVILAAAASRHKELAKTPDFRDRYAAARDNAALFARLVPEVTRRSPDAVFVVVSNPVDLMTYLTLKYSGLPASRVLGAGTLIDTARFRTLLAEHVGIHTNDLRAYILGEHGDSQFPALSVANAGGEPLGRGALVRELADRARNEGHRVFAAKGYTNYAIAGSIALILEAIGRNSREVFPISTLLEDYHGVSGVCLSVPVVVGRSGIMRVLRVDLSDEETKLLEESAAVLRRAIAQIGA